jgi:hypothetical protein
MQNKYVSSSDEPVTIIAIIIIIIKYWWWGWLWSPTLKEVNGLSTLCTRSE